MEVHDSSGPGYRLLLPENAGLQGKSLLKRIPRVALLLLTLVSLPLLSQPSPRTFDACADKKTQAELNSCANEEAKRADAELNSTYRTLLSKAAPRPESVAKIKAAERAWIAYRDAYTEATFPAENKQAEYGSMYPMLVNLLRAKLTQQQITALKDLLDQYSK
jgi:uncharacterized protein YecT (DUF1311 family)